MRTRSVLLTLSALLLLCGCPFCPPVPAAIKTEISLVDTMVDVAAKELDDPNIKDEDKLKKARGAFRRLQPHTQNLLDFAESKKPTE